MNDARFTSPPDIYYSQNNGTVAVWPTRSGMLGALVQQTVTNIERCWLFMDIPTYTDDRGNILFDHQVRGVISGQYADHKKFLLACRELGLHCDTVGYSGPRIGYVPCSNGKRASGSAHEYGREGLRQLYDWTLFELMMVRIDLPTPLDLANAVAAHKVAKEMLKRAQPSTDDPGRSNT
jgi:hypothetical protein